MTETLFIKLLIVSSFVGMFFSGRSVYRDLGEIVPTIFGMIWGAFAGPIIIVFFWMCGQALCYLFT